MRDATKYKDIVTGLKVEIENREGLFQGIITEVLTNRDNPKGIKVRLDSGVNGRIKKIIEDIEPPEIKNETDNVESNIKIKEVKDHTVISISDNDILPNNVQAKFNIPIKKYSVTTKFFKAVYCKKVHDELKGIVIFIVNGENINIAVYKINKYLKKFCISKDIKYEVIKVEDK